MSSWHFDPDTYIIRNTSHGTWEIDLKQISDKNDLLYWILQAAQHEFNMKELFDEFRKAITFCFDKEVANGALALKEIFNVFPTNHGAVDWMSGKAAK